MKFVSRYEKPRITIRPDHYEFVGQWRQKVDGLHVQFDNHAFDTEAQGWDDETRTMVEQELLRHEWIGRTMNVLDESEMDEIKSVIAPQTCLFRKQVDGESWLCPRPAVSEDGYCEIHATEVEAPVAKPNRRKVPAA